jgi:hypothetical protein
VLRVLAALIALPTTAFALSMLIAVISSGRDWLRLMLGSTAATVAALGWYFALSGDRSETRVRLGYALRGGCLLGGIGFVLGFLGPIIVTPEANQGPLLGIFITGPAGFVVGVILGALYATLRGTR